MEGSLQRSRSFCQASVHLRQLISVLMFSVRGCRGKWMLRASPEASLIEGLLKSSKIIIKLMPLSHMNFPQLQQRQGQATRDC